MNRRTAATARAWSLPLSAALAIASCGTIAGQPLDGAWQLSIRDPAHHERAVARIRFTGESAPSCMGGDWKRVVVESVGKSDEKFFPLSQPLSYAVEGSQVTIGRNEVCDAYLRLRGTLEDGKARGAYSAVGKGGGERLGDFTLERLR
jgi:hypothetical protein